MKLFDEKGTLKSGNAHPSYYPPASHIPSNSHLLGKQKLIFYLNREADWRLDSSTPGELYDMYQAVDYAFNIEKVRLNAV
jgi:hypothetical protein